MLGVGRARSLRNILMGAPRLGSSARTLRGWRYVGDDLVMRLHQTLTDEQIDVLNNEFSALVESGRIRHTGPLPDEEDHLDLPRLVFRHTHRQFGLLRALIDRINGFAADSAIPSAAGGRDGAEVT